MQAFERSFKLGFGIETDLRDCQGSLVVAHDPPPTRPSLSASDFFGLATAVDHSLPLAINIKSDGLQEMLLEALASHRITNYFLFDMSVPDALLSIKAGLRVFTRQSDVEVVPNFYDQAQGVWLDAFYDDSWITPQLIEQHLNNDKSVCLVSPEIHGRDTSKLWDLLASSNLPQRKNFMLCTDIPEKARSIFEVIEA